MTKRRAATDPLLRPCAACDARAGEGCRTVLDANGKPLTRHPHATRLVHANRIEEGTTHA